MIPVTFLPGAEDDLLEIYVTIGMENEPAARRQVDRIRAAVRRLHDYPYSASPRPDVAPDARGIAIGHYVALHRVTTDDVQIVRIMHMAQDPSAFTSDFSPTN